MSSWTYTTTKVELVHEICSGYNDEGSYRQFHTFEIHEVAESGEDTFITGARTPAQAIENYDAIMRQEES